MAAAGAGSDISVSASGSEPPAEKKRRTRLSCSCDRCRQRKIRCDEEQPACSQCVKAGVPCVVSKPAKNPYIAPVRQKTGMTVPIRQQKRAAKKAAKEAAKASKQLGDSTTSTSAMALNDLNEGNLAMLFGDSPASTSSSHHSLHPSQQHAVFGQDFAYAKPFAMPSMPSQTSPQHQQSTSHHSSQSFHGPQQSTSHQSSQSFHGQQREPNEQTTPGCINEPGMFHSSTSETTHGEKYVGASSSQVLVRWLDEGSSSGSNLADHLKHAVSRVEEFTFPGVNAHRVPLPPNPTLARYLDAYFRHVHPIFPVVDEGAIRNMAAISNDSLSPVSMTLLHLIVSQGADSASESPRLSKDGRIYLEQAWLALPSVMSQPYRTSLQVLLLLCHALRTHQYEGTAWMVAGLATRMAYSLGVHHQRHGDSASLDARLFFGCFVLDKMLSFECGRPSAIVDASCTVSSVSFARDTSITLPTRPNPLNFFGAWVEICRELSFISTTLFTRGVTDLSIGEALYLIAKADERLTAFVDRLPGELRPQLDGTPPADDILPYIARVHCMYYLALITLHRLSLFDEGKLVLPMLNAPVLQPYAPRLRASATICVSAARGMLSILERLSRIRESDRNWTSHCALTAIYVLAIRTYKVPESWQAKADLMFLKEACDFTARHCEHLEYPPQFVAHLPKLYSKVERKVIHPHLPSRPATRPGTPAPAHANVGPVNGLALSAALEQGRAEHMLSGQQPLEVDAMESTNVADLWRLLLGDGLTEDPVDTPFLFDPNSFSGMTPQGPPQNGYFSFGAM